MMLQQLAAGCEALQLQPLPRKQHNTRTRDACDRCIASLLGLSHVQAVFAVAACYCCCCSATPEATAWKQLATVMEQPGLARCALHCLNDKQKGRLLYCTHRQDA